MERNPAKVFTKPERDSGHNGESEGGSPEGRNARRNVLDRKADTGAQRFRRNNSLSGTGEAEERGTSNMKITIRQFEKSDIPKKVEWVNNPENNQFLHYDIPLSVEKTERWFDSHLGEETRFDAVIEADGLPVGTIGLLSIDRKNSKAEYYIAMGETAYKRKGVAKEASRLLLQYGFEKLGLNRIYLFTETGNIAAQRLFERVGFQPEGTIREDIMRNGNYVDRIMYGYLKSGYRKSAGAWTA